MNFIVAKARYHPLYGLELTDQNGVAYATYTKRSILDAGAVLFIEDEDDECPYRVKYRLEGNSPGEFVEYDRAGTDDPMAHDLAWRAEYNSLVPFFPDWQDVPLPPSFPLPPVPGSLNGSP